MRDYYEAEMRLLRESAREFARLYPEQAAMLNIDELRDRDPYVERLLEGMAYLSAHVRRRLDDDVPELCEALLNQLWPHFLRPFPAATIVQFSPRPGQLQQAQLLARGALLMSPPLGSERVISRFRTTSDLLLQPLHLKSVQTEETAAGATLLRLRFQLDAGLDAAALHLKAVKLHIHADAALALKLYHLLVAATRRAEIRFPDLPDLSAQGLGGQETIQPCHLGGEDLLVPGVGRSFLGYHLLQEYFCFREKYLFVELGRLDGVDWPSGCQSFEIRLTLDGRFEPEERLTRENLRLHCAPAINLFETSAEPIRLTHRRSEYPLLAEAALSEGVEIYSLDEVVGIEGASGARRSYQPLHGFRHKARGGRFYQVARREQGEASPAHYLAVGGIEDFGQETLSCALTACNGDLPHRHLPERGLSLATSEMPSYLRFANLLRPTARLKPPARRDFRLTLLAHLSLALGSLDSPEALRQLLRLYDWSGRDHNQRRIAGITELRLSPVNRIRRGGLLRGVEVRVGVREDHFINTGDVHLFGELLHVFFSRFASLNLFVETLLVLQPSARELRWQPLFGDSSPL
ncbi:type VI secretion system baseplate subunit TssF [Geoalkalibacter sp.]|uniref:type VI secretion system baseplate subunit TssF n=1 Tax=Geoalkalibacter sp. TaxID=3041440 RepID=UPI00272E25F3|nr:type VI secretion system baseplate subunit TssF [Geoalkalibacter sp.]